MRRLTDMHDGMKAGSEPVDSLEFWESWDSDSVHKVPGSLLQCAVMDQEQCTSEVRLRL